MLLLHGGGQTAHSWDEFSRAMRAGYHVMALDARGHGDSDWSKPAIYTTGAHIRDIHGIVKALNLRDLVLVGLSMGARNAIVYGALHTERLRQLIVVENGPEIMKDGAQKIVRFITGPDILPSFQAFVERAHGFNPRRPLEQLHERLRWNLKELPDGRWTWKYDRRLRSWRWTEEEGGRRDLWPYVRRITTPTLLVRGMVSNVMARDAAVRMAAAMPTATLVEVENAGHTVPGDNPPAFAAVVKRWLAEQEPMTRPQRGARVTRRG